MRRADLRKKPTYLVRGAPSPIRKYRMAIAHRAAPLDPLDEPLSTPAVVPVTPPGRQVAILSTAGVL